MCLQDLGVNMDKSEELKKDLMQLINHLFTKEIIDIDIDAGIIGEMVNGEPRTHGFITEIKIVHLVEDRCKDCKKYETCNKASKEKLDIVIEKRNIDLSDML